LATSIPGTKILKNRTSRKGNISVCRESSLNKRDLGRDSLVPYSGPQKEVCEGGLTKKKMQNGPASRNLRALQEVKLKLKKSSAGERTHLTTGALVTGGKIRKGVEQTGGVIRLLGQ